MQAIVTKYLGPTNFRGSRIKATAWAGSVTIPYPHELSGEDVHRAAADALLVKLGWTEAEGYGPLVGGGLPDQTGYAFCFGPREPERCRLCGTLREYHRENQDDGTPAGHSFVA